MKAVAFYKGSTAASKIYFNGKAGGGQQGPIITATSMPVLTVMEAGDTIASAYTAGSYASTAGTISSAVATYLRNGVSVASSTVVADGDVILVSVLVTDSAGNTATFETVERRIGAATFDSTDALFDSTAFTFDMMEAA